MQSKFLICNVNKRRSNITDKRRSLWVSSYSYLGTDIIIKINIFPYIYVENIFLLIVRELQLLEYELDLCKVRVDLDLYLFSVLPNHRVELIFSRYIYILLAWEP